MAEINVYQRYFKANLNYNGRQRNAASVLLISTSENGQIKYEAAVAFFPHDTEEDFAVSYDAYFSTALYEAKGRRSRKKEKDFIDNLQEYINKLSNDAGGVVFWDQPITEAKLG